MTGFLKIIRNFWERWKPPYRTEWVEDLPEKPRKRTVYIIGGRKHPFYAAVVCPRKGCGHVAHLGLSKQFSRDKRWRVFEGGDGAISLFPSVHVTGLECGCHYWLRNGKIEWSENPSFKVPKKNKGDL